MDATAADARIDEAAKKSGLVWVQATGLPRAAARPAQPVWHVWQDGVVYVLTGGLEQPAPGGLDTVVLDDEAARALVIARGKDTNGRQMTFETTVDTVPAGSEEWTGVVPALVAARLNLPDGEAAPARWEQQCTLWRLRPTGVVVETALEPSTASHAAEPPPTKARSRVPRPLHLRGRPRRNRGGH